MKKNLRIVSAAAAALLAVAPVAATVVPATSTVQAADLTAAQKANMEAALKNVHVTTAKGASMDKYVKVTGAYKQTLKDGQVAFKSISVELLPNFVNQLKNATVKLTGVKSLIPYQAKDGLKFKEDHGKYIAKFDAQADNNPLLVSLTNTSNPSKPSTPAKPADTSSTKILNGTSVFHADANTTVTLNAVAKHGDIPSAVNGGISVSLGGENFDALLHTDGAASNVEIFTAGKKHVQVDPSGLTAGHYIAVINRATVAFGAKYANTDQTLTLTRGQFSSTGTFTKSVHVNQDGVADLGEIQVPFYAYDATKMQGVNFYEVATGNVVKSGNVTLHAVNGQLTAQAVYAALNDKYGASQFRGGLDNDPDVLKPVNDIKDQLKAQNVPVDPNGYFKAPASFTINMHAKSNLNGAEATLPVTVNVDNVTATAAQETTKTVTIMHISTIYDKNGKATHDPALRAYDTYSVVSTPVTLKDEKGNNAGTFYKLAGKDQYIKVGNVDGTSRSLKHNSYVYKSTGKRNGKKVLKKGSSVTTYGKSFMIAGHQMYRIGRNQYVKKANF